MDAKKIRNAGVISTLSLALALGLGFASSMSAGAQGNTATSNEKPDPAHPIVRSINGKSLVVAVTPDYNREVTVDASTLVVKDGKFTNISALKVGDVVQLDVHTSLPNGLEGHGTASAAPQAPAQPDDPANPDKSGDPGRNQDASGQPDAAGGTTAPNTSQAPPDPNHKENGVPTDAAPLPGEGNANQSSTAASVILVTSGSDVVYSGVVHWAQGDTIVLNTPNVAYSEYVIHTATNTGYQQLSSVGAAISSAKAADLKVGASVVVLGTDGGSSNPGFFTANAVLVVPSSMKLR